MVNLALDSYFLKSIESALDDFFNESKSNNQLLRSDASPSILALEQPVEGTYHNPLFIFKPNTATKIPPIPINVVKSSMEKWAPCT